MHGASGFFGTSVTVSAVIPVLPSFGFLPFGSLHRRLEGLRLFWELPTIVLRSSEALVLFAVVQKDLLFHLLMEGEMQEWVDYSRIWEAKIEPE
jgi:hypothetical protein